LERNATQECAKKYWKGKKPLAHCLGCGRLLKEHLRDGRRRSQKYRKDMRKARNAEERRHEERKEMHKKVLLISRQEYDMYSVSI